MSRIKRAVAASILAGGLSATSVPLASAVVDGVQAESNIETRSIVGIQTPASVGRAVDNCTGTVVAPEWILTAAHCLAGSGDSIDQIAITAMGTTYGNASLRIDDDSVTRLTRQVFGKSQVFRPDDGTDIALVRLPRALTGVSPATIASSSKQVDDSGNIYGWGIPAGKDHIPGEKLSYAVSTVKFSGKPEEFREELGADFGVFEQYANGRYYYSTQQAPAQVVQGDSGGPLMVDGMLAGVSSQIVRDKASDSTVGVLTTDVSPHAEWIKSVVGEGKASRYVDISAGVGGVSDSGKKVLPFSVANMGSDDVTEVNVEVSPPAGSVFPVGAELVVADSVYKVGESSEFVEGERISVSDYTPGTDPSVESRSFTVRVPVDLKPGEGVQLRFELPDAVEGDYRMLAYAVPGVRPAMFALDATNVCDAGADGDNCASVTFSSGDAKDVVVKESEMFSGVKLEGASARETGVTSTPVSPTSSVEVSEVTSIPAESADVTSSSPAEGASSKAVTSSPVEEPEVDDVEDSSDTEGDSVMDVESSTVVTSTPQTGSGNDEESESAGEIDISGEVDLVGEPDSRPVEGSNESGSDGSGVSVDAENPAAPSVEDNSLGERSQDVAEESPVIAEQPAAAQRILADTGVSGLWRVVGVGLGVILGGVFVLRRRG